MTADQFYRVTIQRGPTSSVIPPPETEQGCCPCCTSITTRHICWFLAFLLFFIAIVGLAVVLCLYFAVFRRDQYGVVFDAGSSHTDMSLFRWPGDKIEETGVVVELDKCDVRGPGITSYTDRPEDAGLSIEECLEEAKRKVPEDRKSQTPVFMGATAGMRVLHAESPEKSDAVLAAIAKRFEESGFKYESGYIRIIDGVEEGISAWVSANLLLGLLGEDGSNKPTVGVLDMDGATTQISFQTSGEAQNPQDGDSQELHLYGHVFPVFSHTFPCFGTNEAERRFKSELVLAAAHRNTVENPCFNLNYTEVALASDLFNTTCTRSSHVNTTTEYTLVGTGDSTKCTILVRDQLRATKCKEKHTECFDETYVPKIPDDKNFLAISGYYHTAQFFEALQTTPTGFKALVDKFCNEPWEKAMQRNGTKIEDISSYCFVGHYVHQILTEIYKFDTDEKWSKIEFSLSIAGVSSGWTLGFMTNATNSLPIEPIRHIHQLIFFALLVLFLALLFVLAIALCCIGLYAHRRRRLEST